jgi:hypothetical protein
VLWAVEGSSWGVKVGSALAGRQVAKIPVNSIMARMAVRCFIVGLHHLKYLEP